MKLPNGYGSITKLTGKRRNPFMVRIRCTYTAEDGTVKEQRSILGYYHTRTEAMQALADYNKSPYDVGKNASFADLYEKWISTKKGKSAIV